VMNHSLRSATATSIFVVASPAARGIIPSPILLPSLMHSKSIHFETYYTSIGKYQYRIAIVDRSLGNLSNLVGPLLSVFQTEFYGDGVMPYLLRCQ